MPITEDVAQMFQAIIEDRNAPKVEKAIDGYSGFLFYDDNGMPLVAMHWQHRFNHMVGRYNDTYPEEEIQNVAYPHNGYADSSHRHIFHAYKFDDHNYGHHADDLAFGSKRHGSVLHKTVQMFFVKVCSHKPGMELFRAFCEAEQRCHIKGNRRQDRKDNPDGAKSKAKKPQQDPEYFQWISHFLFLSHMRFRQLKRTYVHLLLLLSDQYHKVHECFPL